MPPEFSDSLFDIYSTMGKALFIKIIPAFILIVVLLSGFTMNKEQADQLSECTVESDSLKLEFFQVKNSQGVPLFYYQDINQYPCDDSVCSRMVLRIYWDMWGNFLKVAMEDGQQLTKIGHEPFSDKDYERLHKLLNNPACNIQYYKLDELTEKESEKAYYSVDAVSSATIQNVTYDSVKGAVKTCYTLWKIVHGEVPRLIKAKTAKALGNQSADARLREMVRAILSDGVPTINFQEEYETQPETKNTAYLLCLLEINRRTANTSKDLQDRLAGLIKNEQSASETAIYNFLLLNNFRKKEVKHYKLSYRYF